MPAAGGNTADAERLKMETLFEVPQIDYLAYGLRMRSAIVLPGLVAVNSAGPADIIVNFDFTPTPPSQEVPTKLKFVSSQVSDTGVPTLHIWEIGDEFLRILYHDECEFWLDRALSRMWIRWPATGTLEGAMTYLLGPIFGLILRLLGTVCLHASATVLEGSAVAFVGQAGSGKSTIAAGFAQLGLPVLSDDVVPLKQAGPDRFEVIPAYPRVNLWPASVKLLYGAEDALPAIVEDWDKKFLALGERASARFEERPVKLGAVYVFDDAEEKTGICAVELSPRDALIALVANSYATNLLDAEQRAQEFAFLSSLVQRIPVRKLNPRRGDWSVAQLCEAIRADLQEIATPHPLPVE
jgi:energy-coupling factor transporter ATP-binding protein EcfA2